MTRARAPVARAPVASLEPSSMTSISRHVAAWCSWETTLPMACSSFIAGMTTDTVEGSAKELLHDPVPGHEPRARLSGTPQAPGQSCIAGQTRDRAGQGLRRRCAHKAVLPVDDEFEGAAGIISGDDRLSTEKRFERDVAEVLIEWCVDDRARVGV